MQTEFGIDNIVYGLKGKIWKLKSDASLTQELSRVYLRFLVLKSEKNERKCLGNLGKN